MLICSMVRLLLDVLLVQWRFDADLPTVRRHTIALIPSRKTLLQPLFTFSAVPAPFLVLNFQS
ncbi:hypothetical protein, partial [Bifidobacterium lemurum]|uniref:hypothetical protein n=1 Tax=Bifidobacterium lemurum TaxID=1603886 RepID=UPI0019684BD7